MANQVADYRRWHRVFQTTGEIVDTCCDVFGIGCSAKPDALDPCVPIPGSNGSAINQVGNQISELDCSPVPRSFAGYRSSFGWQRHRILAHIPRYHPDPAQPIWTQPETLALPELKCEPAS
jgi:hypothetical protein